ncbi:ninjurin-2-like isoform X1 [Tachypleus tridentatus]|uniref:ninjurin-2-like isoform X1 n=1 Tax=Tachypleus tridentatus TaxID=6853 RepID=UPI003FD0F7A6
MGEEKSPAETSTTGNENESEKPLGEFLEISDGLHSIAYQPENGKLMKLLDPNVYATKKTIAQGMLDVALFTANASQLKYILHMGTRHEFYYLMVTLISISIILQILVGVLFVIIGRLDVNREKHQPRANSLNNIITIGIFVITIDNILIASFGMKNSDNLTTVLGNIS